MKGGYLKVLKHLHSEQVARLNAKNQQECDLLEDIRSFTKQRSTIERTYGEALLKLATSYQNRKIACVPDIRLEDGSEAWNVYSVWRTVLDETEKLGKCRLAGVEVFQQHISEDAKQTRLNKINLGKKLSDQLVQCQKELQLQVQELDRLKKIYSDEESVAVDAREKASAAEDKLKRKKGSIFQSITSLQKNSAKFASKRDLCDEKSHGARNDYILALVAANAHQRRYYEIDFERILRTMECDMYDKVAEYLTLLGRTELLTCSAAQVSYTKIRDQAQTITRGYNLRCYLTFYPMLGQNVQYDFDPTDEEKVGKITIIDSNHKELLEQEGKKCVARITKEVKVIRDCCRRIQKLQSGGKPDEGTSVSDPEARIEELKQLIRRAETEKMKAEARVEALREGGVEIEDYSKSVDSDSLAVDMDATLSRSGSSLSVREEGEANATEYEEAAADNRTNAQFERQATDASVQQQNEDRAAPQESFATWDPVNPVEVDWGDDDDVPPAAPPTEAPYNEAGAAEAAEAAEQPAPEQAGVKCIALYAYTSQNPDELSFMENEELELLGEGDGDGWVSARNYKGEVGFIPQNYIEVEEGATLPPPPTEDATAPAGAPTLTQNISFSSVDYDVQTTEDQDYDMGEGPPPPSDLPPDMPPPDLPPPPPPPASIAITNGVDSKPVSLPKIEPPDDGGDYCVALYDYEATCPEELTFEEGEVIKVLARAVHDVDDGWWMGEVRGQKGLFPSLVVEECGMHGELLTPEDSSGGSLGTTPPPHTPPEVPGFLLPPEGIIITQPTPDVETLEEAIKLKQAKEDEASEDKEAKPKDKEPQKKDEGEKQPVEEKIPKEEKQEKGEKSQLYQRQFSSSPDSESTAAPPQDGPPAKPSYDELISSPDASVPDAESATKAHPPPPGHKKPPRPSTQKSSDEGLGVAEIVITAATPMAESSSPASNKAAPQSSDSVDATDGNHSDGEGESMLLDDDDHPPPPPPAPSGGGVSAIEERRREEEEEEANRKDAKKFKVKGGNSIELSTEGGNGAKSPTPSEGPPDLDLDKLKDLDRLKESDA